MRSFILGILIICIFTSACLAATQKPILVLSTCSFEDGKSGALIWPEIAVDPDGKWRKATVKDLWRGQEFKTINGFRDEWPELKFKVNSTPQNIPVPVSSNDKWKGSWKVQVVYSKNQPFTNKGTGEIIKPEEVDPDALKEFKLGMSVEKMLHNVVKADWKNIKKDFPNQTSTKVTSFLVGDINGDGGTDYILVLGAFSSNGTERTAESVLMYVKENGVYKRYPVRSWFSADFGPVLLWTKDFNGDNRDEIFIGETDFKETIPFVYSWSSEGLIKLYEGQESFLGGM